jgi:hypothetical protein
MCKFKVLISTQKNTETLPIYMICIVFLKTLLACKSMFLYTPASRPSTAFGTRPSSGADNITKLHSLKYIDRRSVCRQGHTRGWTAQLAATRACGPMRSERF